MLEKYNEGRTGRTRKSKSEIELKTIFVALNSTKGIGQDYGCRLNELYKKKKE